MDAAGGTADAARVYLPTARQRPIPAQLLRGPESDENKIRYELPKKRQLDVPRACMRDLLSRSYDWPLGADMLALVAAFYGDPCFVQMETCDWNTEPCTRCKAFVCVSHRRTCELCGRHTCAHCDLEIGHPLVVVDPCTDHSRDAGVLITACLDCIEGKHDQWCNVTTIRCNRCDHRDAQCEECQVRMCIRHGTRVVCGKCA